MTRQGTKWQCIVSAINSFERTKMFSLSEIYAIVKRQFPDYKKSNLRLLLEDIEQLGFITFVSKERIRFVKHIPENTSMDKLKELQS